MPWWPPSAGRLIEAMVQTVADKGYPATTVADVVERAGVSRKTFYEQFPDREACFLAAYDAGVEYVLGRLAEAGADLDGDWRERLRSNIEYLPVRARGMSRRWPGRCTVQVLSAGRCRARAPGPDLRALLRSGPAASTSCGQEPRTGLPELPREAFQLHSGGVDEMVRESLRTHGAAALPELVEPAVRSTIALFGGAA